LVFVFLDTSRSTQQPPFHVATRAFSYIHHQQAEVFFNTVSHRRIHLFPRNSNQSARFHQTTSPAISSDSRTVNPSQVVNTQDACPLFKLAVEIRNEIYSLVFAVETNDDGSVELNESTTAPSKALVMTCQVIRSETRAMYKAAYQNFPKHTFTSTVHNAVCPNIPFIPALSRDLFSHMRSFRLHWRDDENNAGHPLRFTSHLDRNKHGRRYTARVELHDVYLYGALPARKLVELYTSMGEAAMGGFILVCDEDPEQPLDECLAFMFGQTVCAEKCGRAECRVEGL
jgi:hypothetical protein